MEGKRKERERLVLMTKDFWVGKGEAGGGNSSGNKKRD